MNLHTRYLHVGSRPLLSRVDRYSRLARAGCTALVGVVLAATAGSALPASAAAAPQLSAPYGEVGHFGGFDATASVAGKLVLPTGFAVDPNDSSMPDHTAVYVLDNLNPENDEGEPGEPALRYRIQKLSDTGTVVGHATFSLSGSAGQVLDRHAVALAVDGQAGRVYVLIEGFSEALQTEAAERIDVWSTTPVAGALPAYVGAPGEELTPDPVVGGSGSLLSGPTQLEGVAGGSVFYPEGMALAGTEAGGDLELGGQQGSEPLLERIATQGAHAGELDGAPWSEKSLLTGGLSGTNRVTGLARDLNGEVDVTLRNEGALAGARGDEEPYLASVGFNAGAWHTTQVLPDALSLASASHDNPDRAAVVDLELGSLGAAVATSQVAHYPHDFGLGPFEVGLGGGVYAGLVAHKGVPDEQNPAADPENSAVNASYAWRTSNTRPESGPFQPASFGIRLFDAAGESLGMIGNVTPGGPCNLQGGRSQNVEQSYVALAAGPEGEIFALVQSDLSHGGEASLTEPAGEGEGDIVMEFKPGAGSGGAPGQQCPEPSGGFKVDGHSSDQSVVVGSTVNFDASTVDLHGGSPWAYEWDLDGNATNGPKGDGFETTKAWSEPNTQAASFTAPLAEAAWAWAEPTASHTYCAPGTYPVRLRLDSDFGAYDTQRTLTVDPASEGPLVSPTPTLTIGANPTVGHAVTFTAAAQAPSGESITDYHWEFGDGQSDDTGTNPTDQHVYSSAGPVTVTLTVTDSSSCATQGSAAQQIVVSPAASEEIHTSTTSTGTSTTSATTTTNTPPPADTSPTVVLARVASTTSASGAVQVSVSCPASKPSCAGSVTLTTVAGASTASKKKKGRAKPKALVLGRKAFTVAGGHSETVQVKLSGKGLSLLRSKHTLAVVATIVASDPGGHSGTVTKRLTLHAPAVKRRGHARKH